MADYYQLNVQKRDAVGSAAAKVLRRNGSIPANYYYKDTDNTNLLVDDKELFHALHSGQRIFAVELGGDKQYVMIKEIQYHPVTDIVMHVDFMRIRRAEKITISVPIHLEGDAPGVVEGGVLSQIIIALDIECLPINIPEFIPLDISNMEMKSSVSVADINISGEITIITASEQVIATIAPPKEEEAPKLEEVKGEEGLVESAVEDRAEPAAAVGKDTADDGEKGAENAE